MTTPRPRRRGRATGTLAAVKSNVEVLEDNRVKLTIEVDEEEFDAAVDAAFKRIAREVRLPGFRPGKAPRRVLEAQLGHQVGREEALREALPEYYSRAVVEHDVDVIAPPEIEITRGQESGAVAFDAVVETRPRVTVAGHGGLRVEIPAPRPSDDEIDEQLDRIRRQFAELEPVDRPAVDGDHVTIDITGTHHGEEVPGLTASDYDYEVGSGAVVEAIDENLRGASAGDILEFDADHPDPDEEHPLHFRILVKEVKRVVLPELDDELAAQASEFDTLEELRADIVERLTAMRVAQANAALREKVAEALAELVDVEAPAAMVDAEVDARLQDLVTRLRQQGVDVGQYLEAIGKTPQELAAEFREPAVLAVKVDLGLRAVADLEDLWPDEERLDEALAEIAERAGTDPAELRRRLAEAGQLSGLRADLAKHAALDWLVEHAEIVDPDGNPVDRADLEFTPAGADEDTTDAAAADTASDADDTDTPAEPTESAEEDEQ